MYIYMYMYIYICMYKTCFDSTLAWTKRSIVTQPRTVVGSVHLKLWWLDIVKVKRRPGPQSGQELVYDKNMHHAHNCSVARFNPKVSGKQNRTGRVRNRKARPNFQVPKSATFFFGLSTPSIPLLQSHVICKTLLRTIFSHIINLQGRWIQRFLDLRAHDVFRVGQI